MNAQMSPTPANPPAHTSSLSLESLTQRLRRLNLHGLLAHAEELIGEPWLGRVLEIEDSERQCRSLKRRTDNARLGKFKSLADFDHHWPKQLDKTLLEELFTFDFLEQGVNVIIVGWMPSVLLAMYYDLKLRHEGGDLSARVDALAAR